MFEEIQCFYKWLQSCSHRDAPWRAWRHQTKRKETPDSAQQKKFCADFGFQGALSLPGCDGTFGNFRSQWVLLFSPLSLCFSLIIVISFFLRRIWCSRRRARTRASQQASQPASKQANNTPSSLTPKDAEAPRTEPMICQSPKRGLIVRQKGVIESQKRTKPPHLKRARKQARKQTSKKEDTEGRKTERKKVMKDDCNPRGCTEMSVQKQSKKTSCARMSVHLSSCCAEYKCETVVGYGMPEFPCLARTCSGDPDVSKDKQ